MTLAALYGAGVVVGCAGGTWPARGSVTRQQPKRVQTALTKWRVEGDHRGDRHTNGPWWSTTRVAISHAAVAAAVPCTTGDASTAHFAARESRRLALLVG